MDRRKPWKIELQLACLQRCPDVGMIWTDMEAVDEQGEFLQARYLRTMYSAYRFFGPDDLFSEAFHQEPPRHPYWDEMGPITAWVGDIYSQMMMGKLVHTPTVLLRRERCEQVGGFDESL